MSETTKFRVLITDAIAQAGVDFLREAGAEAEWIGRCTYAEEDLFYSYRRTTHRGEADYGRQISAIVLEDI